MKQHAIPLNIYLNIIMYTLVGTTNILHFAFLRRSLVSHFGSISFNCPTVVCQHFTTPFALISLFHMIHILVETLSVLVTYCTAVFWEIIEMRMKKMNLK